MAIGAAVQAGSDSGFRAEGITLDRVQARGKFLFAGKSKFFVKGVTYGAFRPDADGREFQDQDQTDRDFALMAEHGINTVRIPHTTPPPALLDAALRRNLRVMVGLSAEQYAGYLIDTAKAPDIEGIIRRKVREIAGHPALLCYSLGNEIAPGLARWLGRRRIEKYLERLYRVVKDEDPNALVTYVNYPTTEYLQLPFLDLLCFNVYLEKQEDLTAYQARLHNIAGERPLLMTELGLDSMRHGLARQAEVLDWQIRTSFRSGCAGAIVFSWTDEWYRGGGDVVDWAFGLTDRYRRPKPALTAVRRAFEEFPEVIPPDAPRISVVVCSFNGARTIGECLRGLERLRYPNYEIIVVDDGSTDATAEIASRFNVRLIRTSNMGLSAARNAGMRAASGDIVAYIDDDAYPDPDWLYYLWVTFSSSNHAAAGGPNLPPPGDPAVAQCVARAPGGPTHVLLTDTVAEHIPGCNMAIRKSCLEEVGGFDPQFRIAGDDVDLCWRLQQKGWTIGFSPGAVVWHHRRPSVSAYLRQQEFYGRAEALLERKWPGKFNEMNQVCWSGRVYAAGVHTVPARRALIYHGVWGQAPFQPLYGGEPSFWSHLPLTPEWHLVNACLLVLCILALAWPPLFVAVPLLLFSLGWPLVDALRHIRGVRFEDGAGRSRPDFRLRLLTLLLRLIQPFARLRGRMGHGLTLWRRRPSSWFVWPRRYNSARWSESWVDPHLRLASVERAMQRLGLVARHGGPFDSWDLSVQGGLFGSARLLMSVEDQGSGTQYVRVGVWPHLSRVALVLAGGGALLSAMAWASGAVLAGAVLAVGSSAILFRAAQDSAYAQQGAITAARLAKQAQ